MMRVLLATMLLAVPLAGATWAFPDQSVTVVLPFYNTAEGSGQAFLSGGVQMEASAETGTFGFVGVSGEGRDGEPTAVRFNNLRQVCWQVSANGCASTQGTGLEVLIEKESSFAMRFPGTTTVELAAGHALGSFLDLRDEQDLEGLRLAKTFVGVTLDSEFEVGLPPVMVTSVPQPDTAGSIVLLEESSSLIVRLDGNVVHTGRGASTLILVQGQGIGMEHFAAEATMLSVSTAGTGTWTRSDPALAQAALEQGRLDRFGVGGSSQEHVDAVVDKLGPMRPLLGSLMAGAFLKVDDPEAGVKGLTLARFDTLTSDVSGLGVAVHATGPLVVEHANVHGAQALVGVGWVQVPWWTFLLWGIAIIVVVVRMVRRAPKSQTNDGPGWVRWLVRSGAGLLVFFLWDQDVRALLGASVLQFPDSATMGMLALFQIGFLAGMAILAQWPLSLAFQNAARLFGQGRLWGAPMGLAILVGYLLSAPLLLSYLQVALHMAG